MPQPTPAEAIQIAIGLHQAGRFEQAELIYRNILSTHPNHPDALHLLGVIAGQTGRHDSAIDLIRQAIAIAPNTADYHCNLGLILQNQGQLDQAIASYQRALTLRPNYPDAYLNLGVAWKNKGELDQAIASYQRALELKPDYPAAHNNLGNGLKDKGKLDEAIACYQRALALNPDYPEALLNLGIAWKDKGQYDQAIACYQQLLKLRPNSPGAYNNLGIALWKKGEADQAIASYQRALELKPNSAEAYYNLGIAWKDKGQFDQAIICYQKAIELKPDYLEAYSNLGNAWGDTGQLDLAIACYRKAIELNPQFLDAHDNLLYILPFHPTTDLKSLSIENQQWNHQHAEPLRQAIKPHHNDPTPDRRLRIGYVSPDFRNHPVGRFLLPLLAWHDHAAFDVYCYCDVPVPDEITAQLQTHANTWRNIVGISDEQVTEMIRHDQIDILIDLTMHMANNRLLVFARKPAPVQVTYLAYAGGTAVDAIDYRLTDRHLDPNETDDKYYTEKSIRLAGTYWCYQPGNEAPPVNELPALTTGKITFGCLNNFCKVTQSTLETWATLLSRLPLVRLLLYSPAGSHRDVLLRFMDDRGIASDRIELVSRASIAEYFEIYRRVDIALDPFPYTGGTTTCDALWMGVPVVTLSGQTGVGRSGVSILNNAGLPELAATTTEQYIQIAADLAGDLPRLSELRSTLRERMRKSALMDAPKFAQNIEAAYKSMWRNWCHQ